MSFVLEALIEWVGAHFLGPCLRVRVPDDVSLVAEPECVYEYLFADGVRNWGRKVAYVAWLKAAYGHLKGFMILCKIHKKRLR